MANPRVGVSEMKKIIIYKTTVKALLEFTFENLYRTITYRAYLIEIIKLDKLKLEI